MKLTFHGGAGSVTGSNYLLESDGTKILIDCGLIQGEDFAENKNFAPFPYNPEEVGAVFITHAHIDHTGRLPKLIYGGFKGKVYSTPPTKAMSEHMLEDSTDILRREAKKHEKDHFYTKETLEILMQQWETVGYHKKIDFDPFKVKFYNAGHILGSAFIEVEAEGKKVVFSGDLGNSPAPLIKPREDLPKVDYCLVESTYGGRTHLADKSATDQIEDIVEDVVRAGGNLIIPAFAMERTQKLIFHIHKLMDEKRIPEIPIFLDSPLAARLTEVYHGWESYLNKEAVDFIREGHNLFSFPNMKNTVTREESKGIFYAPSPKIIIAGAGMSQGGRIIYHEKFYLPDPKNTILFIGYQVEGSLGRRILEGEKEVEIFGKKILVKASVKELSGYSAHADQSQLLSWLRPARFSLKKLFVVQGEKDQARELAVKVRDDLAVNSEVPEQGQAEVL